MPNNQNLVYKSFVKIKVKKTTNLSKKAETQKFIGFRRLSFSNDKKKIIIELCSIFLLIQAQTKHIYKITLAFNTHGSKNSSFT